MCVVIALFGAKRAGFAYRCHEAPACDDSFLANTHHCSDEQADACRKVSRVASEPIIPKIHHPCYSEKVVLVYRTEQDTEMAKQEQEDKLCAIASIRTGAIKKHAKSIKCAIRRLFGSTCPVCQSLSDASMPAMSTANTGSQKLEEGAVLENINNSTTPTMIDTTFETGLLGMVTTVDILNQLSFTRQHLNLQHQDSGHLNARQSTAKIV